MDSRAGSFTGRVSAAAILAVRGHDRPAQQRSARRFADGNRSVETGLVALPDRVSRPPGESLASLAARRVVDRLAWPFFAWHWFLSELYASTAMHRSVALRLSAWPLLLWARVWGKAPASQLRSAGTRSHEEEDALKAAADKVGRHLFDVRLRLVVQAPANAELRATRKLREIVGAFGQFTSPRLSRFHLRRIRRSNQSHRKRLSLSAPWSTHRHSERVQSVQ